MDWLKSRRRVIPSWGKLDRRNVLRHRPRRSTAKISPFIVRRLSLDWPAGKHKISRARERRPLPAKDAKADSA
jgi:hypothetical protein